MCKVNRTLNKKMRIKTNAVVGCKAHINIFLEYIACNCAAKCFKKVRYLRILGQTKNALGEWWFQKPMNYQLIPMIFDYSFIGYRSKIILNHF